MLRIVIRYSVDLTYVADVLSPRTDALSPLCPAAHGNIRNLHYTLYIFLNIFDEKCDSPERITGENALNAGSFARFISVRRWGEQVLVQNAKSCRVPTADDGRVEVNINAFRL